MECSGTTYTQAHLALPVLVDGEPNASHWKTNKCVMYPKISTVFSTDSVWQDRLLLLGYFWTRQPQLMNADLGLHPSSFLD